MSRDLYESLFAPEPTGDEATSRRPSDAAGAEAAPSPLLRAFARAAARRRAAQDLAEEEYRLGLWAEVDEEEHAPPLRLAAQDRGDEGPATWRAGPFELRTWLDEQGLAWVQQDAGPAGVTLEHDAQWHPLQPGKPTALGRIGPLPPRLRLHDATGRTWKLERVEP